MVGELVARDRNIGMYRPRDLDTLVDPFGTFERVNRLMDYMSRELFRPLDWDMVGYRNLNPIDIEETPEAYLAKIAVPGFDEHDIKVRLEGNILEIEARKEAEVKSKESHYRGSSSFLEQLTLPYNVDRERINASYKNGMLELKLPKVEPRNIPVNGER
jgi:HSP20 family protein